MQLRNVIIAIALIALSMLRDHSWLSFQVLGLLALAAVLLVAFFITERRVEHPIVPFGLFRLNVFAVPALIAFFSAIGMFGAIVFVPLVYQGVLGVSASNSGQLLTPMQVAVVLTATATGVLLARVPRYRFVGTAALAVMIVGLVLLAQVGPHSSPWEVTSDIILIGAGLGVTFPLTLVVVQAGLPHHLVGVATSQITFWRSLGGTIGTAVLGAILTNNLPARPSRLDLAATLHDLFLLAAAVAVVSLIVSVFLREVPLTQQSEAPVPAIEGVEAAA
jgi:predicted MFS family arabinose efflux permease